VKTSFGRPFQTNEEHLADQDSFECGIFCLVNGSREDPYHGQP
jgi:hypothetical protein